MTRTTQQSIGAAVIGACIFLSGFFIPDTPQQERQYTLTLPESQMNVAIMLINGQKDRVSLAQKEDLDRAINLQLGPQAEKYRKIDSAAAAVKKGIDSSKSKKP